MKPKTLNELVAKAEGGESTLSDIARIAAANFIANSNHQHAIKESLEDIKALAKTIIDNQEWMITHIAPVYQANLLEDPLEGEELDGSEGDEEEETEVLPEDQ